METSWTDRVKCEEVLYGLKRERRILRTRNANCIGLISRRNCFLKHAIAGKI